MGLHLRQPSTQDTTAKTGTQIGAVDPYSEQIKQLLTALPEPSKSVATLLVLTGLRIGELLALRWKNVDLDARTLRITETVYDGHFDSPENKAQCPFHSNWVRIHLHPFRSAQQGRRS